jgi:hypothetical protein
MLATTSQEIVQAFASAKNLNAALKNFLKREGRGGGEAVQSFAKSFRNGVVGRKPEALVAFVEANYPKREVLFMGLVRYAHADLVESTVGEIIDKHADRFNTTYERSGDEIKVTNRAEFDSTVKDVVAIIDRSLAAAEVARTNFLVNSIVASVFEPDVLREVYKVMDASA